MMNDPFIGTKPSFWGKLLLSSLVANPNVSMHELSIGLAERVA